MNQISKVAYGVVCLISLSDLSAQTLMRKQLAQIDSSNSVTIIPADRTVTTPTFNPSVPMANTPSVRVGTIEGARVIESRPLDSISESMNGVQTIPQGALPIGSVDVQDTKMQDVEILNLAPELTEQQIEERLKHAERVDAKESLSEGEWVDDFPVDPCPQTVAGGELGFWFKVGAQERCAIKEQVSQEQVMQVLDRMMYDSMCTDPKGVLAKRYEYIVEQAHFPQHVLWTKNSTFIQAYENQKKICGAVAEYAPLFAPVLSVRHVATAKVQSKSCKAALVEAHALSGIIGSGRFNFVVGLGECTGLVDWMPNASIWYEPAERQRIEAGINAAFGWSAKSTKVRYVQPPVLKQPLE